MLGLSKEDSSGFSNMVTPFVCHFVESDSHPSLYLDVLEVANCFVGLQKIGSKNEMLLKDQWFLYAHP